VLETLSSLTDLKLNLASHDFGGIAIDNHGVPLPDSTLEACKSADAILLGKFLSLTLSAETDHEGRIRRWTQVGCWTCPS
jgi:isocitrate/isopropylmalate dehydrogenase